MHLSDCSTLGGMTAMDLSEKCEVEEEVVLSQMTYWSSRGVVRTRRNDVGETFYEIIEVQAERAKRDLEETLPGASNDVTEQVLRYLLSLFSSYLFLFSSNLFLSFFSFFLHSRNSSHLISSTFLFSFYLHFTYLITFFSSPLLSLSICFIFMMTTKLITFV